LFRLVIGAEQVARHFGDRHQVARIDLRFIFLRAARPHGTLDLGLALERFHRFFERLVGRKLAHAHAFRLVGRHAERHALFFEAEHIELQLHTCDLLLLQFDHTAHAMLGVNDIITNVKGQRLGSHLEPFQSTGERGRRGTYALGAYA